MSISLKQAEDIIVFGPEQDCIVLVSPPGTGKSSAAVRAAQRMSAVYLPVYAATMEAIDARGLPMPVDAPKGGKLVGWAAPSHGSWPSSADPSTRSAASSRGSPPFEETSKRARGASRRS